MQLSKVGRLLPASVRPLARSPLVRYRFMGLRPIDAVLASYPKSGSTWFRFLLTQVLTGREVDYDAIRDTMPPVGRHRRAPALLPTGGRVARTHEPLRPWRGRADQPVIYLLRDGRDVCISYFNHLRRQGNASDLPTFVKTFLDGGLYGYGPWHEHVLSGLEFGRTRASSVLIIRYEDLRAQPVAHLDHALAFLGVDARAEDLAEVITANKMEHMRAKAETSTFLRTRAGSGSDGTDETRPWAEALPPNLQRRFVDVCGSALAAAGYESTGNGRAAPGSQSSQ